MEITKTISENYTQQIEENESFFSLGKIFEIFILNWYWFLISLAVCLSASVIYVKRTMPVYRVSADFLVKDNNNNSHRSRGSSEMLNAITTNGFYVNSEGFDNEIRILQSKTLARDAVKRLQLYITVSESDGLRHRDLYRNPPFRIKVDNPDMLESLGSSINMTITRNGNAYEIDGHYSMNIEHGGSAYKIHHKGSLPVRLMTQVGPVTIVANPLFMPQQKNKYTVTISSPYLVAAYYAGATAVAPMSKTTTIAHLTHLNSNIDRARDYLTALLEAYNYQANEDKNEVARKTEEFINQRLEKISVELGSTDSQLQSYKQAHSMYDASASAGMALGNQNSMEAKLDEANMQLQLLNYLSDYLNDARNKHQIIPSNIGLSDGPALGIIQQYNQTANERNRLLAYSSENSPSVVPLTDELDRLQLSIRKAIDQAKQTATMQIQNIQNQYSKYSGRVTQTPEQERILTSIGRQQEVRSSLYIMLLQKREDNSLSLSATANKGRMIDDPLFEGQTAPKSLYALLIGLALGLGIPLGILMLIQLLKYKVEGHDDLVKLTKIPIIADVILSEQAKDAKAGIVVRADKNGTMEEIFRGIRTNLNFLLKESQNVILFTSSISGEGKTFNAANTAMSFALLKKRVVIVGLDIRKPRLGELFGFRNVTHSGISNLLRLDNVTADDVRKEIVTSGVNDYLDLLMAGPIPPNPSELLAGNALDQVITHLKEDYDYVILDTAPVSLVTDTLIINRVCDTVIFVSRADYTPKEEIKVLNELVEQKKLTNVSLLLNAVDMSKKKYGYQYGYGKYGKYGRYGKRYGYGYHYSYGYHYGYGYGQKKEKK